MPKPKIDLSNASSVVVPKGELQTITPDQIYLDPVTDVRKGSPPKDEADELDELARGMYSVGQLQPILCRRGTGKSALFSIIAGRRRVAAAKLIEAKTSIPWPLQALIVEMSDDEAWEAALAENIHRRNFSDIEFAQNCMNVRDRKGLTNSKDWTKGVATFLGVSRATVLKKTQLLLLPVELQAKVHAGTLKTDAAYAYMSTTPADRAKVLADAEELAENEMQAKQAKQASADKKSGATPAKQAKGAASDAAEPKAGSKKDVAKVQKKHIVAAARKNDALEADKPRTRTEILEYFSELTGPAFPAPMVQFAQIFLERWVTGQLKKNTVLTNQWHVIGALVESGMRKSTGTPKKSGKKAA